VFFEEFNGIYKDEVGNTDDLYQDIVN